LRRQRSNLLPGKLVDFGQRQGIRGVIQAAS